MYSRAAAFDDFDFDQALLLYAALPLSRKSVGRMLQCAQTIGRPDAAQTALAALDSISDAEAELPAYLRATVSALRALLAPPISSKEHSGERPAFAVTIPDN